MSLADQMAAGRAVRRAVRGLVEHALAASDGKPGAAEALLAVAWVELALNAPGGSTFEMLQAQLGLLYELAVADRTPSSGAA